MRVCFPNSADQKGSGPSGPEPYFVFGGPMSRKLQIDLKSAVRALLVSIAFIAFFIGIVVMYYRMLYNTEQELIKMTGEASGRQIAAEFERYSALIFGAAALYVLSLAFLLSNNVSRRLRNERLAKQLSSTADIYISMHEIDFLNDSYMEVMNKSKEASAALREPKENAQELIRSIYSVYADDSTRDIILDFTDFSKLDQRLKDTNTITCEFKNNEGKWRKARFIVSGRAPDGRVTNAMYLVEDIDAEREEREKLTERISSIANIYVSVHEFDIVENMVSMIKLDNHFVDEVGQTPQPHAQEMFHRIAEELIDPEYREDCIRFFDFSTLPRRMKNSSTITIEFHDSKNNRWGRGRFIVSKRDEQGNVTHVLYVTEDITDEKAERDRLIDASERALAASEAKSSFLSNMSHEIRTPINAVLGMNEMILRECNDKSILEYSESIRTAGATLLGLVNDILDFSKIEAGKMEIIPVDYDLSSLINDLVNMIQTKADSKGLKLEFEISEEVPKFLRGDEVRIKQVVTNILTNAVKYTEKGIVTLCVSYERIEDEPDSILLDMAVKDTGIGIRKEDMKKLFSEFDRIEEKRNRNIEGTGLGMSITKRLLEMMGSSLQVESIYGLGSRFSFRLKQSVVKWEELGDYETSYRASLESREKYHESFRAPEAEILIVDDTPMNLEVFKNLLKKTEIKIETADSGEEALSLSLHKKYDVIFLDHMMPDKDGIQTLHELREREKDPNLETPAICLTANAISGAREKYLAEGFNDYLTKPINSVKLEEMLMHYLPGEKVLKTEGDTDSGARESGQDPELPACITAISEIDTGAGIANCGGPEGYLNTIRIYAGAVREHAEETERLWNSGDIKNTTIKIHALKSSSRIIGATMLGELAQELENAGNEGNVKKLSEHMDELLSRYRAIGEGLSPLLGSNEQGDSGLTPITGEELSQLYTAIREFISVDDYDSVIDLIEALKGYSVPDAEKERRSALIKAADEIRYEDISEILEKESDHAQ